MSYLSLLLAGVLAGASATALGQDPGVGLAGCRAPAGWSVDSSRSLGLRDDLITADWILVWNARLAWNADTASAPELAARLREPPGSRSTAVIVQRMDDASCADVEPVLRLVASARACTPETCFLTAQEPIEPPPPPELDD